MDVNVGGEHVVFHLSRKHFLAFYEVLFLLHFKTRTGRGFHVVLSSRSRS